MLLEIRGLTPEQTIPGPVIDRPQTFGPESGTTESTLQADCSIEQVTQTIYFTDRGRVFQAIVRFQPEATPQRRAEAYQILDSLEFTDSSQSRLDGSA